jgi:hypothetical protein
MTLYAFIIAGVALAQTQAGQADNEQTYVIELDNGQVLYGFVDDWDAEVIAIELDEPWNPSRIVHKRRSAIRIPRVRERQRDRENRIEKGWQQAGYTKVRTPNGMKWLSKEEVRLADKAREMAGLGPWQPQADETAQTTQDAEAATPERHIEAAAPRKLWGIVRYRDAEIALAAVALIAAGLIGRYWVFR